MSHLRRIGSRVALGVVATVVAGSLMAAPASAEPAFTIDPESGPAGSDVAASGTECVDDFGAGTATVAIGDDANDDGALSQDEVLDEDTVVADDTGAWNAFLQVPSDTPPGVLLAVATCLSYNGDFDYADRSFTVTEGTAPPSELSYVFSPASGPPGTTISFSGKGCPPSPPDPNRAEPDSDLSFAVASGPGRSSFYESEPDGTFSGTYVVPEERDRADGPTYPTTVFCFSSSAEAFDGDFTYEYPEGSATMSGRVTSAVSGQGLAAIVHACPESPGSCSIRETAEDGTYTMSGLLATTYVVKVWGADPSFFPLIREVTLTESQERTENFALAPPRPAPAGTTVGGVDMSTGSRRSIVGDRALVAQGCAGGATYQVFQDDDVVSSGAMTEEAGGLYRATLNFPVPGSATVSVTFANCPDQSFIFDLYIDPSGFVRDLAGNTIPGATVVLFRSDSADGPFAQVPNGSILMSPGNRTNPDRTDGNGHFGWDVVPGFYRVRASATGCSTNETAALQIPPPVTNIDLRLTCAVPVAAPSSDGLPVTGAQAAGLLGMAVFAIGGGAGLRRWRRGRPILEFDYAASRGLGDQARRDRR